MIDDRRFRLIRSRTKAIAILLVVALLLAVAAAPAPAQADKRIALSFDDVPRHPGGFMTPDERTAEAHRRIARGRRGPSGVLRDHRQSR